jgi:PhoH-like ATPase
MKKKYILDTSVLLDNPDCIEILRNGEENDIYIPYSVILELDKLKHKKDVLVHTISEIGSKLEIDDKVTIIKHADVHYSDESLGDEKILVDIKKFIKTLDSTENVKVITNDKFFRIRLRIEGIEAEEFKSSHPILSASQMHTGFVDSLDDVIPNSFMWVDGKPNYFCTGESRVIDYENNAWNIKPKTVYQNLAMELMLDPNIDIVTLQSPAGYGKTFLALASAFQLVLQKPKSHNKIYITKPNIEIGEKLGFLPGDIDEKLSPYFRPIEDLIIKLHGIRPANALFLDGSPKGDYLLDPKKCEVLPLNFVRGMTIEDAVIIIDEAQNLTRSQVRTILTRMGENVKCFVLGDVEQVDNPYLNKFNNGMTWIVEKLKGFPNYGHMVLKGAKSRGPITDIVLKSGL